MTALERAGTHLVLASQALLVSCTVVHLYLVLHSWCIRPSVYTQHTLQHTCAAVSIADCIQLTLTQNRISPYIACRASAK